MTEERPNKFAHCETVGSLFDALWYHATGCVQVCEDGGTGHSTEDRRKAIVDAHKRYEELMSK